MLFHFVDVVAVVGVSVGVVVGVVDGVAVVVVVVVAEVVSVVVVDAHTFRSAVGCDPIFTVSVPVASGNALNFVAAAVPDNVVDV